MKASSLTTDNAVFSSEPLGDILLAYGKTGTIKRETVLANIEAFLSVLKLAAGSEAIKALVFIGAPGKTGAAESLALYRLILDARREDYVLDRLLNVVTEYTLVLAGMDKCTVHADQGRIAAHYFNTSLAFDYRILADDAVIENPHPGLGLLAKGSAWFLSRRLGTRAAADVMTRERITAAQALELGIVDALAPRAGLKQAALDAAGIFADRSGQALRDAFTVLKADREGLRRSLDIEDRLIVKRVNAPDFPALLQAAMGG